MSAITGQQYEAYEFERGYPTPETTQRAREDADYARAIVAYHFWYPTVSIEGAFFGSREAGVADNQSIAYGLATPRWVTFTPNSDTPYAWADLDLKDAPMVVDIPPGPIVGFVEDHHQRWVADLGLTGPDKDRGGKFLLVAPDYRDEPPPGCHIARSSAYKQWIIYRAIPQLINLDEAKRMLQSVAIYPLGHPEKRLTYVDLSDADLPSANALAWEDNIQYWQKLHEILDYEPVVDEMRPMYGLLMQLGIVKGAAFAPDARMKSILERAARDGKAQMLAASFDSTRPDRIAWQGRRWEWVALTSDPYFETPSGTDLEARGRWFAQAIGSSPAGFQRSPGAGSLYWQAVRDKDGNWLDGSSTYKLTVPLPVPARLFWSVTVYDNETRCEIATAQGKAALRSMFELKGTAGRRSVDLYFGSKCADGEEGAWIETVPGKGWLGWLRVYGPDTGVFDGSWKPGDFEKLS